MGPVYNGDLETGILFHVADCKLLGKVKVIHFHLRKMYVLFLLIYIFFTKHHAGCPEILIDQEAY